MATTTLRYELRSHIFDAFNERTEKRAVKARGEGADKVFSYSTRNNLLDRANDFAKWIRDNRIAKHVSDLRPEHVTAYLDDKAAPCTQATLNEYRHELKKIGQLCGIDLSAPRVIASRKKAPDRGAQDVISSVDLEKLCAYAQEHPSHSATAVLLEREIGVRVSGAAYGVRIERDKLLIRDKAGKVCVRPLTSRIRAILRSNKSILDHPVKAATINAWLRRVEDKLGLERHSFHSIRRRVAQDKYDELRHSGVSRTEALRATSVWLNHGPNREDLLVKSYITAW